MRKNPRSPCGRGGVGEVIERLFVTIFSFVADGVTYSSTCTT